MKPYSALLQGNNATGECEKAGIFKYVASMALKIFKIPVALVAFTDKKGVLKLATGNNGADETKKANSFNSTALLKKILLFLNAQGKKFID